MRTRSNIISRRPQANRTGIYGSVSQPIATYNFSTAFPTEFTYVNNVIDRTYIGQNGFLERQTNISNQPRLIEKNGSGLTDGVLVEIANLNLAYLTDYGFANTGALSKWDNNNITVEEGLVDSALSGGVSGDFHGTRFSEVSGIGLLRTFIASSIAARTVTSEEYYTQSIFVNSGTDLGEEFPVNFVQLSFISTGFLSTAYANFNIITGAMGTVGAGITRTSITDVGGGWWRISATALSNATSAVAGRFKMNMIISSTAANNAPYNGTVDTRGGYMWGAQYENNERPTTYYIQDNAGDVTKPADNIVLSGSNFSSTYNSTSTTTLIAWFYFDQATAFGTGLRTILSIDTGANKKLHLYGQNGTLTTILAWTGSQIISSASLVSGLNKIAITISGTTNCPVKICLNGGTVVSGTSDVTKANQTWLNIGSKSTTSTSGFSDHLNDVFVKLFIYNTVLSDAQLQSGTA